MIGPILAFMHLFTRVIIKIKGKSYASRKAIRGLSDVAHMETQPTGLGQIAT